MRDQPVASLVLPLADPHATLERVGGKGASLARLAVAGLPVPPGFHITTAAYRRFVAVHNLQPVVLAATAGASAGDPATLEQAASRIGAAFATGTLPDEIAQAMQQAYALLGEDNRAVAVRSSATAEDLPGMSFAGQQESYLNIQGETQLLDAIKRCWASLWTARAIGYRTRRGILPQDVSLAIVVQELVPAEVAGVLFTANPITGVRDEIVINAAWGLGEAIVGGVVTPDTFVVNKRRGSLVAQQIADKAVMTVRTVGGTQEAPVAAERRRAPTLSQAQAEELAELGARIEALYAQPMDIEWTLHEGRISAVQARPITALPAPAG